MNSLSYFFLSKPLTDRVMSIYSWQVHVMKSSQVLSALKLSNSKVLDADKMALTLLEIY